jgi:molybdopterin-guanine dinucleotide biosynthesis protein A
MRSERESGSSRVTGLILAGGRGSRMGNIEKGLQPFRNLSMIAHVMQRLEPQVGHMMISANQEIAAYRQFGAPVYPDQFQGYVGPLAGMHTGLMHCTAEYLAVVPCDSPFLPMDLVARMLHAIQSKNADMAIAVTGEGAAQKLHPVFCLLKISVLPHLTAYLGNGGRKVQEWAASLKCTQVFFTEGAAFRNINTLEDLRKFEYG